MAIKLADLLKESTSNMYLFTFDTFNKLGNPIGDLKIVANSKSSAKKAALENWEYGKVKLVNAEKVIVASN